MASTETGELNTNQVTTGQDQKVATINETDASLEKALLGYLNFDAAALSGTQVLTESQSRNALINIVGALGGAMTLELDADLDKEWLVRDQSTGAAVTLQRTGESGVTLPKNRWVFVKAGVPGVNLEHVGGWQDDTEAGALSFAANYQVVSGRELKLYKEDAEPSEAGGLVLLTGAVEETTTNPVAGDTIVTLPAGYRPLHAVGFVALAEPASAANAQPVAIEVQTSGAVVLRSLLGWTPATNAPIDLSGVSFMAGN